MLVPASTTDQGEQRVGCGAGPVCPCPVDGCVLVQQHHSGGARQVRDPVGRGGWHVGSAGWTPITAHPIVSWPRSSICNTGALGHRFGFSPLQRWLSTGLVPVGLRAHGGDMVRTWWGSGNVGYGRREAPHSRFFELCGDGGQWLMIDRCPCLAPSELPWHAGIRG